MSTAPFHHALRRLIAIALLAIPIGTARPQSPNAAASKQHVSRHFTINYSDVDPAKVVAIAAGLETARTRIVKELGGAAAPMVTVTMHTSATYAPGAVGTDQIHVVSPTVRGWSLTEDMVSFIAHEFTHCVMLYRNPSIANNPRWLWESIAMYEAVYRKDPTTLSYLTAGRPPTMSELNSPYDPRMFDVGYLIGEFVVQRWGAPALLSLIDANGVVDVALGVPMAQFEKDWFAWVRQKYSF
jgi:hypothetical protein